MAKLRRYLIGETVNLKVQSRDPYTGAPINATTVTLDSFTLNGLPVTLLTTTFTNTATGVYELSIPTDNLDPGIYHARIKIEGSLGVAIEEDTFVIAG